jgi:hypothetical protein
LLEQGSKLLCISEPNAGYIFSSWSADVPLNTIRDIPSVLESAIVSFTNSSFENSNNQSDFTKRFVTLTVNKSGTLNANFATSTPIPTELWAPFYGIIPAVIGGMLIPWIFEWKKEEKQRASLVKLYEDKIENLKIPKLKDDLEKEITDLFKEGKVRDANYYCLIGKLKERISKLDRHQI